MYKNSLGQIVECNDYHLYSVTSYKKDFLSKIKSSGVDI